MASVTFPLEYDVIPTKPVVQIHLIVDCVLVAFAWLVVGLRLMARTMSGAGMGWDDYLIVAALVRFFFSFFPLLMLVRSLPNYLLTCQPTRYM